MSRVTDFMTRDPITIRPGDSVQRAAQLMDELNVGALPVCEGPEVLGIVTDRDITVRATAAGLNPMLTRVDLVMTDRLRCCAPGDPAAEALEQMSAVQIRRLLVLDAEGRLMGIVSLGDLAAGRSDGVQETLRCISTPSQPDRVEATA